MTGYILSTVFFPFFSDNIFIWFSCWISLVAALHKKMEKDLVCLLFPSNIFNRGRLFLKYPLDINVPWLILLL